VSALGGNIRATVSPSAPPKPGSSPTTGYTMTAQPGGATTTTTSTPATITGPTSGRSEANVGAAWVFDPSIPAAPGAPRDVWAAGLNGEATVSFTAPASTGSLPVSSYTVTTWPSGVATTTTSTSVRIGGLTGGGNYWFTVSATNADGTGPEAGSNAIVVPPPPPPPVETVLPDLVVSLLAAGPDAVLVPGRDPTVTVDVANLGAGPSSNTRLLLTLPENVSVSDLVQPSRGACALAGSALDCDLVSLAAGESLQARVALHLETGTQMTFAAQASQSEPDGQPADNSAGLTLSGPPQLEGMQVSRLGPASGRAGDEFQLVYRLTNRGIVATGAFSALFNLERGVVVGPVSGPAVRCTRTATRLACSLASLAPGKTVKLTLLARHSTVGTRAHRIWLTPAGATSSAGRPVALAQRVTVTAAAPISLNASTPLVSPLGQPFLLRIVITNNRPRAARGIYALIRLSSPLNWLATQAGCNRQASQLRCNLRDLPKRTSRTLMLRVQPKHLGTINATVKLEGGRTQHLQTEIVAKPRD
jgi:hypothetical protein